MSNILALAQKYRQLWRDAEPHEKSIGGTTPELREALFTLLTADDDATPAPVAAPPADLVDAREKLMKLQRATGLLSLELPAAVYRDYCEALDAYLLAFPLPEVPK